VKISTTLRTLRYLRFEQLFYRAKYSLFSRSKGKPWSIKWGKSDYVPFIKAHDLFDGKNAFTFLNTTASFSEIGWQAPKLEKLWRYNLHYHNWLLQENCDSILWMGRWIKDNPVGFGEGWEPYPIALRLMAWIKTLVTKNIQSTAEILESIGLQAGYLADNLEFHIGANHLLEDLFALYAVIKIGHVDSTISKKIFKLLQRELNRQFLADGAHYELSPMYHAILMERILDVINLTKDTNKDLLSSKLEQTALAGLNWLRIMTPDNSYALFNDSNYGAAPKSTDIFDYGSRLFGWKPTISNAKVVHLKESGYVRVSNDDLTMIQDVGLIGPSHQPGHSHCDLLSYVLSKGKTELIIDSGNFTYVDSDMRHYCRSTAAHNTVSLLNQEQSEIWASHRVGRRAYPVDVNVVENDNSVTISAAHNGYRFLSGHPIVKREISALRNRITVTEIVSGKSRYDAVSRIHLAPSSVCVYSGQLMRVEKDGVVMEIDCTVQPKVEKGWYCPEFNKRIETEVLVYRFEKTLSYTITVT
jgi:hypothetical protein